MRSIRPLTRKQLDEALKKSERGLPRFSKPPRCLRVNEHRLYGRYVHVAKKFLLMTNRASPAQAMWCASWRPRPMSKLKRWRKADVAIRLEQMSNKIVKSHNVDILCAYPLSHGREDDSALKSICAEHTTANFR
jgi:hypothetical protein